MAMKLEYKYYVVNSDNKIVCGFPTEQEAVACAKKSRYKVFSINNLHNKGIDATKIENWSVALFDATNNNSNGTKEQINEQG